MYIPKFNVTIMSMKKIIRYILPIFMAAVLSCTQVQAVFAAPEDEEETTEYIEEAAGEDEEEEAYEEEAAEDDDEGSEEAEETEAETEEESEEETGYVVESDESGWPIAPEVISGSVLMIEANTGAELYSKDPDTKRYPASTTKILTCLIALENCSLNETVTYSLNAVTLEEGSSSIDAVEGEQMSMKDCLYGLMLPSGNDCAIAIAEHIAGSVENFAEMMNERAEELGCTGSHFVNPNGLYDSDHYTTASDLCKIAQAAFNNSAFVEIVSHATYTIEATNMSESRVLENTNYMIVQNSSYYNDTVVGGKTGYLAEAGRCLVTMAKSNGMTVITVCMFCSNYNGVFLDTQELLDYVFNGFALNNISESESRFNFASEGSKVMLDSTAQILMPASLSITDLDSEIEFAYDMDLDEFNEASENAGIIKKDGRHLYAIINYSYAGNYLGHINVLIDDNMEVEEASFTQITYINSILFVIGAAAVVLISFLLYLLTKKKRRKKRRTKVMQVNVNSVRQR